MLFAFAELPVNMFSDRYRQLVSAGVTDPTGEGLIRRVEDAICADAHPKDVNANKGEGKLVNVFEEMDKDVNGLEEKDQNDWYCRYQELLSQSDLWREKADERDRFFQHWSRKLKISGKPMRTCKP